MDTAETYREFARSAHGSSPIYERLADGVAGDSDVLALLGELPEPKRQPNLLLGAVAFLTGALADYGDFRGWLLEHRDAVVEVMLARRTQTNEVGRCATLLPALGQLPGPLALLEVGASAGLCLLPDRYGYDYAGHRVGPADAELVLSCTPRGPVPLPSSLPEVVWRAGVDLHPIDIYDEEEVRWLEALVWPDQPDRLDRLRTAVRIARRDPPQVIEGDLLEELLPLAAEAPADARLVIFHSAVLTYLTPRDRERFADLVQSLPAVWLSNEGARVLPALAAPEHPADERSFVLSRDGRRVLALTAPHGSWVEWMDASIPAGPVQAG